MSKVFCGTEPGVFCSVGCQARGEHRDWALSDPWVERKDSSEYGWQVMSRSTYVRMRSRGLAGAGTPLRPDAPGFWAMVNENGATVLYTGVTIDA